MSSLLLKKSRDDFDDDDDKNHCFDGRCLRLLSRIVVFGGSIVLPDDGDGVLVENPLTRQSNVIARHATKRWQQKEPLIILVYSIYIVCYL
mmetsp:Transcript_27676/g.60946  ORF Transcript_27676/g.60946 Transcript_27676/m.60946 type:complete len:91 (+) Transcript_27676:1932-2204(+)